MKGTTIDGNLEFLRAFLAERKTLKSEQIRKLGGSSASSVYLVGHSIYRVGPKKEVARDISCYNAFKSRLQDYQKIFPAFAILFDSNGMVICQIEYIGKRNLEDMLMGLRLDGKSYRMIESINSSVLKIIKSLFEATKLPKGELSTRSANQQFLRELLRALIANLRLADMADELNLKKLSRLRTISTKYFQPSIIHRDLTMGNIMLRDISHEPRLIDPRHAIPYLNDGYIFGNVAFDLAGYYVSLQRKEMQLKRKDLRFNLASIVELVRSEVDDYIRSGVFDITLFNLCLLVWYSIYSACRCDYCLANKRKWLYAKMRKKTLELYSELTQL
ncbi:MAG: hypothetical protein AAB795_01925 [Patescibacteria group bacterium]